MKLMRNLNFKLRLKIILNVSLLAVSLFYSGTFWAGSNSLNYKECIVSVKSPQSQNGFGTTGADWIAIHMVQDNIKNKRGIKFLPSMTRITDSGFYFQFYETCHDKLEWSKYYIKNLIEAHEKSYDYELESLSPDEVDKLEIREIKTY